MNTNRTLYSPQWRWFFTAACLFFLSKYIFRLVDIQLPETFYLLRYVILYAAVLLAILQVLNSKFIQQGEKITWFLSLILLSVLALIIYSISFKRIHGFYSFHSRVQER